MNVQMRVWIQNVGNAHVPIDQEHHLLRFSSASSLRISGAVSVARDVHVRYGAGRVSFGSYQFCALIPGVVFDFAFFTIVFALFGTGFFVFRLRGTSFALCTLGRAVEFVGP